MSKKGVSIVEILIVLAILGIAAVSLLGLVNLYLRASVLNKETIKAKNIAQETLEAVRNFRDNIDWGNNDPQDKYDGLGIIATGTPYHPEKSSGSPASWMLLAGEDSIDGFARRVVFENISRDPTTKNIEQTYNPAHHDPETKKVTATILWKNKTIETITILSNWQK